jgi:hypothetical protein
MSLSDAFFQQLADLGERHATDPVVFLDVWNSESGLNPRAENPASHARGLNQMMPRTLEGLGAPANFHELAGEAQLPWIERLIKAGETLNGGPFRSAERYYHSNFFPRTMYRGQTDPLEHAAYAANAGLDPAKNGRITYAELAAFLNRAKNGNRPTYEAARARLALATRGATPAPGAGASAVPMLFGLGVLAAAVASRAR